MTLKEQLLKPLELCAKQSSDDCITDVSFDGIVNESIKIADEYAIGFANFVCRVDYLYPELETKELLEIYKKEKGL